MSFRDQYSIIGRFLEFHAHKNLLDTQIGSCTDSIDIKSHPRYLTLIANLCKHGRSRKLYKNPQFYYEPLVFSVKVNYDMTSPPTDQICLGPRKIASRLGGDAMLM